MMDSNDKKYYEELGESGYASIEQNQQEWYEWAINGAEQYNKSLDTTYDAPQSILMMHIPMIQFSYADEAYKKDSSMGVGKNEEDIASPPVNDGFFDLIKKLGNTKHVIVGHDHKNYSSISYEGVRLTFALKTGAQCYWLKDGSASGGTTIKISHNGELEMKHIMLHPFKDYAVTEMDLLIGEIA